VDSHAKSFVSRVIPGSEIPVRLHWLSTVCIHRAACGALLSATEFTTSTLERDISDTLKRFEFGINFGVGAEYELGRDLYALGYLGQSYGLTEIFKSATSGDTFLNSSKIVIGVLYEL
jgi:hypothetical protein